MQRLPRDIIINHIIPYTYDIQPALLLLDIQHYYKSKTALMNEKYDTNMMMYSIVAVFFDKEDALRDILCRHISKKVNRAPIYELCNRKKFAILFGLFRPCEREQFQQYIEEDDWFINSSI